MWELAQVNVARLRADVGSRVVAGFVSALDPVNRIADESPGFVWRLRWVRAGERPTVEHALHRLALLRADGSGPRAFGLRRRFTPDGRRVR